MYGLVTRTGGPHFGPRRMECAPVLFRLLWSEFLWQVEKSEAPLMSLYVGPCEPNHCNFWSLTWAQFNLGLMVKMDKGNASVFLKAYLPAHPAENIEHNETCLANTLGPDQTFRPACQIWVLLLSL